MKGILIFIILILFLILVPPDAETSTSNAPMVNALHFGPALQETSTLADRQHPIGESILFQEAELQLEEWMTDPKQFSKQNHN